MIVVAFPQLNLSSLDDYARLRLLNQASSVQLDTRYAMLHEALTIGMFSLFEMEMFDLIFFWKNANRKKNTVVESGVHVTWNELSENGAAAVDRLVANRQLEAARRLAHTLQLPKLVDILAKRQVNFRLRFHTISSVDNSYRIGFTIVANIATTRKRVELHCGNAIVI